QRKGEETGRAARSRPRKPRRTAPAAEVPAANPSRSLQNLNPGRPSGPIWKGRSPRPGLTPSGGSPGQPGKRTGDAAPRVGQPNLWLDIRRGGLLLTKGKGCGPFPARRRIRNAVSHANLGLPWG